MSLMRSMVLTLILSAIGAALGGWGGVEYVIHRSHGPTPLHELGHEKLHLTANQESQIAVFERDHSARRLALEAEMRAANAELAQAFQEQHAYTPKVQAAIDRFHHAMGESQKETIEHVLAMRSVLTPQQAAQFDDTVVRSLTEEPR
jgi:Spy/CpxP family protein refolding chaperone